MKIFSKVKYHDKKIIRIFGILIYKRIDSENEIERSYLCGLIKKKTDDIRNRYYFLGIKIFSKKRSLNSGMQKLILEIERRNKILFDKNLSVFHRLITAQEYNRDAFQKYKAVFRGKSVVLMGAGPTVNNFIPIKGAIYVGCNRAFLYDKVEFDFLFSIDKKGIEKYNDDFFNYRKDSCIKFIGDQNTGIDYQIPENIIPLENVHRYVTYAGIREAQRFNLDIASLPLINAATVSIQALQFILYTQPSKIYLVGIDCTTASKQYFTTDGKEYDNSLRGEDINQLDEINIYAYKRIKVFIDTYYPLTKIISINPVGLKGIFSDVYTKSYIDNNPDIKNIISEDQIMNDDK